MVLALRCSIVIACAAPVFAAQTPPNPTGQEIPVVHEMTPVPETMTAGEARVCLDRAIAFLVNTQAADGHWGSGVTEGLLDSGYAVTSWKDWQIGAHAIALMALMESTETPERRAVLDKGMQWLLASDDPKRGNDWDDDTVWAALYTYIALDRAAIDPRFQSPEMRKRIDARAGMVLKFLEEHQVPLGGWGYYDFPYPTATPKWATSFATACVLPALADGIRLGWKVDRPMLERARGYVRDCALPNGAYEYDLNPVPRINGGEMINNVKGSLGRIQVCNWALASAGDKSVTQDKLREGLASFFEEHKFLDVARMRPIPHEAYYQNAGYFYFFGHYYCAQVINLLPKSEREAWHAKLRPHLAKALRDDGSTSDYHIQSWSVTAGTSFAALALALGLQDSPASAKSK